MEHADTTIRTDSEMPTRHPHNISTLFNTNNAFLYILAVPLTSFCTIFRSEPIIRQLIEIPIKLAVIFGKFIYFLNANIFLLLQSDGDVFTEKYGDFLSVFPIE
jgi:hypothetical protein